MFSLQFCFLFLIHYFPYQDLKGQLENVLCVLW